MERAWRACRRGIAIATDDTTTVRQGIAALEEMCRRRHVEMPDRMRPAVYRAFVGELLDNARLLALRPKDVVARPSIAVG